MGLGRLFEAKNLALVSILTFFNEAMGSLRQPGSVTGAPMRVRGLMGISFFSVRQLVEPPSG